MKKICRDNFFKRPLPYYRMRAMSKYLSGIVLFLFLSVLKTEAQTEQVLNTQLFVFPDFSVGVVRMKNNEKINLALNYNLVSQKMVFQQKNQIFDMVNYDKVDTVYIHERKFVPFETVFCEVLVNGPVTLLIQHRGRIKQPPKPAAYGGTSEVSSSKYISNLQMGSQVYRMKTDAPVVVELDPAFWIRKDNQVYPVFNKKGLEKIFSDRMTEIKEFISRRRIDTRNPVHLISVVNYYTEISQERIP